MLWSVTERWLGILASAALIVAACVTVSHAQSQGQVFERQRVLLVPMQAQEGVSPVVPTKVFEYLRTLVELNGDVKFFIPQTLEEPVREEVEEAAETDPILTRADDFLWRAKERAAAGNYLQASNSFKQAVLHYQKGMDNLENFDKLVEARVGIALAFYYAGDAREGRKALRQVVEVRPDIFLDKRKVPQDALDDLEAIKSRIAGTAARPVKVITDPPGAQVFVDGFLQGSGPVVVNGLTVGRHVIRVVNPGYSPKAQGVLTDGRKKKTLKIRLEAEKTDEGKGDGLAKLTPDLVERLLGNIVQKGDFNSRAFKKLLAQLQTRYALNAIVMTYVRGNGDDYEVSTFLYETAQKRIAELEWFTLDREFNNMQTRLLTLEEQVQAGLAAFPKSRELKSQSRIYVNVNAIRAQKEAIAQKRAEAKRKREEIKRKRAEAKRAKAEAKRAREEAKRQAREELKERKAARKRKKAEAKRRAAEAKAQAAAEARQRAADKRQTRIESKRRAKEEARARQLEEERSRREAAQRIKEERAREARDRRSRKEADRRSRDESRRYAREERARKEAAEREREEAERYAEEERLAERKAKRRQELEDERYNRERSREQARRQREATAREEAERRARALEREAERSQGWGQEKPEEASWDDYEEDADDLVGDLDDTDSWSVDDDDEPSLGSYEVEQPTSRPMRAASYKPDTYDSASYDTADQDIAINTNAISPDRVTVSQRSGAWYRKWWVWTAVGAVVVGAAAGTAATLSAGAEDPGFRATVSW